MRQTLTALLGIAVGISALAQSTTETVNVPVAGGTVPVTVTVTPTQVTVGDTVIAVPVAAASAPSTAPPAPRGSACARPPGNTGSGLYVACGRVNNPDGTEWRLRGVNRTHFDQGAATAVALAGANVNRVFYGYQYGTVSTFQSDFTANADQKLVTVAVGMSTHAATTCSNDPVQITNTVAQYVSDASTWTRLNKIGIVNIANEWGPSNSPVWRDAYLSAIKSLRAAGYTMPLMIDAGGCGQDAADILSYGAAVAASDPQKNIILSFHLYGNTPNEATMKGYFQKFQALAQANPNLAVVIGEFGPGRNIGPSPTLITPEQVIADAEATGLGWIAWAWDDNNLGGCRGDDTWFDMTTLCAQYAGNPTELTAFGKNIVGQLKTFEPAKARVF